MKKYSEKLSIDLTVDQRGPGHKSKIKTPLQRCGEDPTSTDHGDKKPQALAVEEARLQAQDGSSVAYPHVSITHTHA